jgi:hypothetical protein
LRPMTERGSVVVIERKCNSKRLNTWASIVLARKEIPGRLLALLKAIAAMMNSPTVGALMLETNMPANVLLLVQNKWYVLRLAETCYKRQLNTGPRSCTR